MTHVVLNVHTKEETTVVWHQLQDAAQTHQTTGYCSLCYQPNAWELKQWNYYLHVSLIISTGKKFRKTHL